MAQIIERAPRYHSIMLFLMPNVTTRETIDLKSRTEWAPDFRGKRIAAARLHVTTSLFLQSIERPDSRLIADLINVLSEVRFMPFWIGFDGMCSFGARDKRPRVLTCSNDDKFQYFRQSVRQTVGAAGYEDHLRRKHDPHITLFYERNPVLRVGIDTIGWTVREFVLVDSWVGLERHEILGRWTLNDPLMSPIMHSHQHSIDTAAFTPTSPPQSRGRDMNDDGSSKPSFNGGGLGGG
jgi:2'-5' RNA ligase